MKKTIDYWEVKVTFNIRKGSYQAKNIKQLKENVLDGIGKNDMCCIEAEDIKIEVK